MIRRFREATARFFRDIYHLVRLCPRCRAGEKYFPFTRMHMPSGNVRLAVGERPRLRLLSGDRR